MKSKKEMEILKKNVDLCVYIAKYCHTKLSYRIAPQGMNEAKNELRHQENLVRQLNRQLQTLHGDKHTLEVKVRDAENALRTAARDKETLQVHTCGIGKSCSNSIFQYAYIHLT